MSWPYYALGGVAAGAFFWEHVGRINKWQRKPSTFLLAAVGPCRRACQSAGCAVVRLSSFYTYLHLGELGDTLRDLFLPLFKLLFSPMYFAVGYAQALKPYANQWWVIVLGSLTLAGLLSFGAYHYRTFLLQAFQDGLKLARLKQ